MRGSRLQVEIDENGRRVERGGEIGGDEGRAAAAFAGKDRDGATAFLRRVHLRRAKFGGALDDGLELFGDDGQAQKVARPGAVAAQDQVGRGITRGADDRRLRTLGGEPFDEFQSRFGLRAERDDGGVGLAPDLRKCSASSLRRAGSFARSR